MWSLLYPNLVFLPKNHIFVGVLQEDSGCHIFALDTQSVVYGVVSRL